MNEDIVIPIAGMIMIITLVLGFPLVRAYVRRQERRALPPSDGATSDERLERIEHAIDAMALEVERISEGQRFVTRLLAERPVEHVGIAAGPQRRM